MEEMKVLFDYGCSILWKKNKANEIFEPTYLEGTEYEVRLIDLENEYNNFFINDELSFEPRDSSYEEDLAFCGKVYTIVEDLRINYKKELYIYYSPSALEYIKEYIPEANNEFSKEHESWTLETPEE